MGYLGADRGAPEMATLVQARSASVHASSPSGQVKAAVGQADHCNWNWEKKILCSTIGVFCEAEHAIARKGPGSCSPLGSLRGPFLAPRFLPQLLAER
jgi:hypothetical protein